MGLSSSVTSYLRPLQVGALLDEAYDFISRLCIASRVLESFTSGELLIPRPKLSSSFAK